MSRRFRYKKNKLELGLKSLAKNSLILMEEYSALGDVEILANKVEIGSYSYFRGGRIYSNVKVERFCSIGRNVTVGLDPKAHPLNWVTTSPFPYDHFDYKYTSPNHICTGLIGADVWIGEGATIMAGVTLGTGAVIAAHSVVTKEVPPYAIVAGIPAKTIGYRFDQDIVNKLLDTRWWLYPVEYLVSCSLDQPDLFLSKFDQASGRCQPNTFAIKRIKGFFGSSLKVTPFY